MYIQSIDGHAGSLFNPDGTVAGSRGTLLVDGRNTDAYYQTPRENAVIPWIHCDYDGKRYTHGLACEYGAKESGFQQNGKPEKKQS